MTAANFLVWFYQIRICLNRRASSNTRSLCGPSSHNTSSPSRAFLAGSWRWLDSPCFWSVFFPALVDRHPCVLIHLFSHDHGADPPMCTKFGHQSAYSLSHLRSLLRPSTSTPSLKNEGGWLLHFKDILSNAATPFYVHMFCKCFLLSYCLYGTFVFS